MASNASMRSSRANAGSLSAVGEGCRLMGLPRSTFYDGPAAPVGDVALVAKIVVICDEFETYGYRRVRAELRHQGFVVNGKKIRRLMRENGLQPKRRKSS